MKVTTWISWGLLVAISVLWVFLLPALSLGVPMANLGGKWPITFAEQLERIDLWIWLLSGIAIGPVGWLFLLIDRTRPYAGFISFAALVIFIVVYSTLNLFYVP